MAEGDVVVELGAGDGMLTLELARRGARVHAVEVDGALVARLRARFGAEPTVSIVHADALRVPLPRERFLIVANLPFGHTTAILRRVLAPASSFVGGDVIVQWDVALKRSAVWPSSLLNAYWGAWFELALVRRLPASVFTPPPAVAAGVLRIVRRESPLVPVADARSYADFLRAGFEGGAPLRRTLRRRLGERELKRLAEARGFDRRACARDLDARQWAALFDAVHRNR